LNRSRETGRLALTSQCLMEVLMKYLLSAILAVALLLSAAIANAGPETKGGPGPWGMR